LGGWDFADGSNLDSQNPIVLKRHRRGNNKGEKEKKKKKKGKGGYTIKKRGGVGNVLQEIKLKLKEKGAGGCRYGCKGERGPAATGGSWAKKK